MTSLRSVSRLFIDLLRLDLPAATSIDLHLTLSPMRIDATGGGRQTGSQPPKGSRLDLEFWQIEGERWDGEFPADEP
jgi:hypothetical protein